MATYFVCVSVQGQGQPLLREYSNHCVELDLKDFTDSDDLVSDVKAQVLDHWSNKQDFIVHSMQLIGD